MRAQWDKGTAKLSPQALEGREIKTVAGGFDDLSQAGIKEGEADLVVIAQAWHWCPDHEKAFVSDDSRYRLGLLVSLCLLGS